MDGNLIFKFQESIGSKQIEFLDKHSCTLDA